MYQKYGKTVIKLLLFLTAFLLTIACVQLFLWARQNYKDIREKSLLRAIAQNEDVFNASVLLARNYYSDINRVQANKVFTAIVNDIREQIEDVNEPYQIVAIINKHIYKTLHISPIGNASDVTYLLPNKVLECKKGHCMGLSLIYMAIGEKLQLPIFAKVVPSHIFVCYDDGQSRFNIETTAGGRSLSDNNYNRFLPYPEKVVPSFYLRRLSKAELLGTFLSNLGAVLKEADRNTEALDAYKKALFLAPKSAEIHTNIGNLYVKVGKAKKAKKFLNNAVNLDPTLWQARSNLAPLYFKAGDYEKSTEEYLKTIDLVDKAITIRAHVIGLPEDKDPIGLAKESLRRKNTPLQQLLCRGIVCFDKREYELANKLFERALELDSEDANIYSFLAATNFHLMNYQQAIKYGEVATEKFGYVPVYGSTNFINKIVESYIGLGKSYSMLKKYDLSIEVINKAIEIGGPRAKVYATLANAYSLKGNNAKAIEFYNKALELDPSYEWARKKLARISID
jgi:tetratricopeptide (TPR) repeat protein